MEGSGVLITGGDGVLGSYCDFGTRIGRKDLDITDFSMVMSVCTDMRPKVIVHCAALTDLACCEENPDKAYLVNSAGTYHLALVARAIGAKLVYVSTSDVFDGSSKDPYTKNDTPNPTNVYGRSKHLGELAVAGTLNDYLILRISWVFGGGPDKDTKFVGKILRQKDASEIRAIADKKGSPVWAKDVARAIQKLIKEDSRGVCNIGGGSTTRYEIAREIASIVGWKTNVVPVVSSEFPLVYSIGDNVSMSASPYMRPWQEALREYIETEWSSVITRAT